MAEHSPSAALIARIEQQLAASGIQATLEASDGSLIVSGFVVERSASDGPPGDEALADAVRRELAEGSATTDLTIVVAVRQGVVHLRGQVPDLDDADNAEAVAARVPGIRDVVEELDVTNI